MKKLTKKNKIVIVSVSVALILALLAALVTMFLYVPASMDQGVSDDIRLKISYFDYENYFFKNGDIVMPFRLKSPKNVEEGKTYPLCVFLHGGGSNGIDNIKSMCGFYLRNLAKYAPEEYFCLVPQAPEDRDWDNDMIGTIGKLLDEFILTDFPVDVNRIYLSGSSMGGRGSILAMTLMPTRFAAAMFDSAGFPYDMSKEIDESGWYPEMVIEDYTPYRNIAMLISHGVLDDVIPIGGIRAFVAGARAAGNENITLKEWPDLGHETVDEFYSIKDNWDWLFSQRKSE